MKNTYRAVEVSAPGGVRVVERPVTHPGAGQVRIRVEACGVCHSDSATVTGVYPGLTLRAFLDMKWSAALKPLAAGYPDGKSVNASVSASLPAKIVCASHADAETR